jgi:two-component system, NarL family, nitrate/nitrite response regulator NarL
MDEGNPKRILIVEDDPVFRAHLAGALAMWQPAVSILEAATGAEAVAFSELAPAWGMALVDLGLPDMDGIDLIRTLHAQDPDLAILVISVIASERSVLAAIRAGARGYILKSGSETAIMQAITEVVAGNYPLSPSLARYLFRLAGAPGGTSPDMFPQLSPRELDTLRHISKGLSYEQTAQAMGVSLSTIQSHIRKLYRKLDVNSQVQAAQKARDRGLI